MVDDADQLHVSMMEGQHGAERRDAVDELLGPVDGVHDPLERAVGPRGRILLADHAVVGEPASDELAQATLDRAIGLRDERGVGLRLHVEAALEGRLHDPARFVRQLDRRGMVALDVAGRDLRGRLSRHDIASYSSSR